MKEITAQQLAERLSAGEDVAVVDIRDSDAYTEWHIAGAANLPLFAAIKSGDPAAIRSLAGGLSAKRPTILVCNRGVSSLKAAAALAPMGYDLSSLAGGMRGWSTAHSEARIALEGPVAATLIQVRRNGKGCLSYLAGSSGRAAVVDPSLDEPVYLEMARREGLRIEAVLETHVHADHLSRARRLAEAAEAPLFVPENRRVRFDYRPVRDGDRIPVGDLEIQAIATPGHTGESTCYLVGGTVLLTGDTLFVDSVGRPDLEKGDEGADEGARALYRSLRQRIGSLPEDLTVCPAHAGSPIGFDGTPVAARLGDLRRKLEFLRLDEAAFVRRTLGGLGAKPPSFRAILDVNEGKTALGAVDPLDLEAGPNRCAVSARA